MLHVPVSVLEVLAIDADHGPADVVAGVLDVARTVEGLGYRRVWYAEHHSSVSLADFPPAIVVAHVASVTSTIRVGSGGVLAVNHSPLSLGEQFAALAAFHPGRIDLGIGRGPGTLDPLAARALRRGAEPATEEQYHEDVAVVLQHAGGRPNVAEPWLLASSPAGARLAATLGLPIAFAYHIRPDGAAAAVQTYREQFKISRWCQVPRVMLCVQTICAETSDAATALARPVEIARAALVTRQVEQAFLTVAAASSYEFTAAEELVVADTRRYQVQGTPAVVSARLRELADEFNADELMLYTPIVDAKDRARSFELIGQADNRVA